jgi:1-deoxyxylulose-5-phosphate synthase
MSRLSRRDFLRTSVGGGVLVATGGIALPAQATKRSATDMVPLGNSGVRVTRLALGTGTFGGRVQRELGQEAFTRLVRHAYDRGVRFFETADAYTGMQVMLGEALKGLPRDSYRLMTKVRLRDADQGPATIDRLRRELNTEYFDILLMHCVRQPDWPKQLARLQDDISEAKHKKIVVAHGASVHGLLPLRAFPGNKWVEVGLFRVNHDGTRMDTIETESNKLGDVPEVVSHIQKIHAQGTGVLGMKLAGEGRFKDPAQRDAALKYVMKLGTVDAVTIGFKSPAEIDEAIERINTHLNS